MIRMPQRSVTRFFIPLLDVMVLLLSMFMLMPIVQKAGEMEAGVTKPTAEELELANKQLADEINRLNKEVRQLKTKVRPEEEVRKMEEELKRLRKERIKLLQQRLMVKTLEMDPKNRALIFYEGGLAATPRVIDSKEKAAALIRKHRQEAARQQDGPPRELYYLILAPRGDVIVSEPLLEEYRGWFAEAPLGIDRLD
jgi:hypothetical protein